MFFVAAAVVLHIQMAAAGPTNIVMVVADDLGYNDLGYMNGGKTNTKHIDGLIEDGILLTSYYTFKVCAPTRTSIMTGRYPWKTGYYDMVDDGNHCVDTGFTMLPAFLSQKGWATHAIGKWDVGGIVKECTPTTRGFDSFVGYYTACLEDYWYHFSPDCHDDSIGFLPMDLSYNEAATPANPKGKIGGLEGVNGTYHAHIFSSRARSIIASHNQSQPLFLYLAPQNVHLGCGTGIPGTAKPHGPIQAPCHTVDLFPNVVNDTWKVQAANLLELDYVVGNTTEALTKAGMYDDTLLFFVSDNGGPLDHTTNHPLRGGKHTFWEGGLRVISFVSGGSNVIPAARRGSKYDGMLHSSDWLPTFVVGVAGLGPLPSNTGPTPMDGVDAWQAIVTGTASPRTEVIHQVKSQYFNDSSTGYALRINNYKLMIGHPGDARNQAWPDAAGASVPFGGSGGYAELGEADHCRAPSGGNGAVDGSIHCIPYCLFDVVNDPGEVNDLANDPAHAATIKELQARLEAAGATAPSTALAYKFNASEFNRQHSIMCDNAKAMEPQPFIEPVDTHYYK